MFYTTLYWSSYENGGIDLNGRLRVVTAYIIDIKQPADDDDRADALETGVWI